MSKKKWALVIVGGGILLWLGIGWLTDNGGTSASVSNAPPKPPAAAFEITQGNLQYYADSYQSQGKSVVLADFYALVEGKWQHIKPKMATILNERNGTIKIRRLN